jgi:hypothetical protein
MATDPPQTPSSETVSARWAGAAFASLGLLTGLLTGLTASSVVVPVLGLIFALLGGSMVVFMEKLTVRQQTVSMKGMFFLAFFCIVGVLGGILISEYRVLTPRKDETLLKAETANSDGFNKYLKSHVVSQVEEIDDKRRNKVISIDDAYKQVLTLIRASAND